jgi:replicative DNA helicase
MMKNIIDGVSPHVNLSFNTPAPQCIDAEIALLGAILIEPASISKASSLAPEDFFFTEHGEIFLALQSVISAGRRPTPLTLSPLLNGLKFTGGMNAALYLGKLVSEATSAVNVAEYALTVREYAGRRKLYELGKHLMTAAGGASALPQHSAADAVQILDEIISMSRASGAAQMNVGDAIQAAMDRYKAGTGGKGVPTGLRELDVMLGGGWKRGELIIWGARPSMGKSAFASSSALRSAMKGYGGLFFSLEMTRDMIAARMASDSIWNQLTPVPYGKIMSWGIDSRDEERIREMALQVKELPLEINDEFGLTMAEIASRSRIQAEKFAKAGKRLDFIVVDHIGKIRASDRYSGNKVHETGEKSNALLGLAKELDCAVVALHQLSRGVEGRDNKRPSLSDLRDSGNLEEDAHVAGFLYRQSYYLAREKTDDNEAELFRLSQLEKTKNDLELIIEKNRNGPCGTVKAFCDMENNVVRDRT